MLNKASSAQMDQNTSQVSFINTDYQRQGNDITSARADVLKNQDAFTDPRKSDNYGGRKKTYIFLDVETCFDDLYNKDYT